MDPLSCTLDMTILSDITAYYFENVNSPLHISSLEEVARAEGQMNYVYFFASVFCVN